MTHPDHCWSRWILKNLAKYFLRRLKMLNYRNNGGFAENKCHCGTSSRVSVPYSAVHSKAIFELLCWSFVSGSYLSELKIQNSASQLQDVGKFVSRVRFCGHKFRDCLFFYY